MPVTWNQLTLSQKVLAFEYHCLAQRLAGIPLPANQDLYDEIDKRMGEIKDNSPFLGSIPPPPPWW